MTTYFDEDAELNQAIGVIEDHIGGAMTIELVVDSGVDDGMKDP